MRKYIWLAIGDSITESSFRAKRNYHSYVTESIGNITVINAGRGGTGYRHDHKGRLPFYKRIERYRDFGPDFITVMGGINDLMLDDGYVGKCGDNTLDSYMGCLSITFDKLKETFPGVPVALLTPVPQEAYPYGEANDLEHFVSEMKSYAEKNEIVFVDLYHDSPLRPWEKENNKFYFSSSEFPEGDGLHPNTEGQRLIASQLEGIIRFIIASIG